MAGARKEGVSRRQARCRISAVNKQEYWSDLLPRTNVAIGYATTTAAEMV